MKLNFRLWLEEVFRGAYWISPEGKIMSLGHGYHIDSILKDPEKFGFTEEKLEEIYAKHGETLGTEGKAREEVMIDAMNRGWIRIRRYNRPDFYSIQTGRFGKSFQRRLADWVMNMIQSGDAHKYSELRIVRFDEPLGLVYSGNFIDFLRQAA
jgi:hypothetical protein